MNDSVRFPEDQEWIQQSHPSDWINPRPSERYNLVVLGGGTAGLVCAAGAAGLGAKVALVEKHRLGGDCLNYGCVPSKALLRSAKAAAHVRNAEAFGVRRGDPVEVDFPTVMKRMRLLRSLISHHDSARRFRDLGVDVYLGEGRFTGADSLSVAGQTLTFSRAVIATGGRPFWPDVAGLRESGALTNETIFDLVELPSRLAVLGGGPIGCELAQAFRRFGSEVHLFHRSKEILTKEEEQAAVLIRNQLQSEGVHFHLSAKVIRVEPSGGCKRLTFDQGGENQGLECDAILVAVGRLAVTENLGLDAAGVGFDAKSVKVNDFLQTTNSRIYSAGDACSPFQFTHAADAMARIVLANALFFGRARQSRLLIPRCTYTDPEIAAVGLSALEAQKKGLDFQSFTIPFSEVDRAVLEGETKGFAVAHALKRNGRLIGATIVGSHAGEMIGEIVLAMNHGLGLSALSKTILPYPTQAEILKKLGDAYQRTRLTPRRAGLLRWLLKWRR